MNTPNKWDIKTISLCLTHQPIKSGQKVSCMEMLQHILDGDATAEQQQHFKDHLDECMPCFKTYNLEVALKTLIKTSVMAAEPRELIELLKVRSVKHASLMEARQLFLALLPVQEKQHL